MSQITVTDEGDRPPGQLEVDSELVDEIAALVETGQRGMVMNLVADLYAADLSQLLVHLPFDAARQLFQWLAVEDAAEVLPELESGFRVELLDQIQPARITALVDELETDDAADVLSELRPEVAQEVLPRLEDAEDLQELLAHAEDTAGGIMGTEFVAVPLGWTVSETTEEVRRNAERIGEIYNVFVVDDDQRLRGKVSPTRLLLSPAHASIESIMETDVLSVRPGVDQEEVARMMQRYDLVSMPVVDADGRLVGRITIDDVVDVIREEAAEDIQRLSGVSGEGPRDSALRIVRGRLPWLVAGLTGAGLSAAVIGGFEGALEEAVVLTLFIPVVMGMAGNAGIQSASIVVQGLANGDVWSSDAVRRLGKEIFVALLNGTTLALLLSALVVLIPPILGRFDVATQLFADVNLARLSLAAGLSLILVILTATMVGTTVPLLLQRMRIDPALASGPFITTSNDIIGLGIYFLVATMIYL